MGKGQLISSCYLQVILRTGKTTHLDIPLDAGKEQPNTALGIYCRALGQEMNNGPILKSFLYLLQYHSTLQFDSDLFNVKCFYVLFTSYTTNWLNKRLDLDIPWILLYYIFIT